MSEEELAQLQRQVQRERTARKEAERLLEKKSLALYRSNQQLQREIAERKKAQLEIEQALNIQRVLDSILNISLPTLTLKEVLLKSLDTILSIPTFLLLNKGSIFLAVKDEQMLEIVAQRNLPEALLQSCAMLPDLAPVIRTS